MFTNNRVPVLQRCGGQREALSPVQGPLDGSRTTSHGGLKDGVKRPGKESDGGHCMPPILTPVKPYADEKSTPGFGPLRKRSNVKAEPEIAEKEEAERSFHPEKRPKICMGENSQVIKILFQ